MFDIICLSLLYRAKSEGLHMEKSCVVESLKNEIMNEIMNIESIGVLEYFLEFIKEAAIVWK